MQWTADGGSFFVSRCKARSRAAEKSWRRTLREDKRGAAGLRSDPIHLRTPWVWLIGKPEEQDTGGGRPPRRTRQWR